MKKDHLRLVHSEQENRRLAREAIASYRKSRGDRRANSEQQSEYDERYSNSDQKRRRWW
ncbi:MAG TPA: hypothetical protein VFC63_06845 [Blastocatellia bacterium]|nr:hypothetical protein [Blastocatellia bacterium]